jgi:hypothetical protein
LLKNSNHNICFSEFAKAAVRVRTVMPITIDPAADLAPRGRGEEQFPLAF